MRSGETGDRREVYPGTEDRREVAFIPETSHHLEDLSEGARGGRSGFLPAADDEAVASGESA